MIIKHKMNQCAKRHGSELPKKINWREREKKVINQKEEGSLFSMEK